MKKFIALSSLPIVSLFLTLSVFAQKSYTSTVPKAVRFFDLALKMYDERLNDKALEYLESAIQADDKFIEAHMMRANIYTDKHEYSKAIASYEAAIKLDPNFFPNNYYSLAQAQFKSGDYAGARTNYEKFISVPKINPGLSANAKKMIQNSLFSEQAVKNPVPFSPVNMGDKINTHHSEYFPAITADGSTFLFTRRGKGLTNTRSNMQEDFYVSTRNGKEWSEAVALEEINTNGNEGAPSLSADGQYLFFTACEEMMESFGARKTKGSCDLFIAKKVGTKFNAPRNLEAPINTGVWESQPSFSSDGRTLYFVRAIKGSDGRTQRDILVTSIGDNSDWTEPVSVSDKINTTGDEMSVFIHPDDQTLYFSSDGHPGLGGLDIFMSKRTATGEWSEPVNLGYPINTGGDENSLLVSPSGDIAYFASDRPEGFGGLDLYQFDLPEAMRPMPVSYMKGKVFDIETKKPLAASFELIDLETNKVVVSSTSNVGNGEFLVCLPIGKSYALNVSKDGYLFYSENFELKNAKTSRDPYNKDVAMKPIKIGESVVLNNIFFEFDKYDLKKESRAEMGKLISFLSKNPKMKIEISGHTDNIGSKGYNQQLSEKRANAVLEYLAANGIASTRLQSKGFGDLKPIADNSTEQGRTLNRRTEFSIISLN
jgi:outer membrane protein OmpA-like peptidoglycan-associated protein